MARLARFWDSLESDNLFDIVAQPPKHSLSKFHQQWLASLAYSRDDELQTILYAKPLQTSPEKITHFHDSNEQFYGAKRIKIGYSKSMLSSSLGNLSAPPKPQRRIARIRSSANDFAASLPQLLEKTTLNCSNNIEEKYEGSANTICSSKTENPESTSVIDTIFEEQAIQNIKLPGFRGDLSKALKHRKSSIEHRTPTPTRAAHPPSYEQFQLSRRNSIKSGQVTPISSKQQMPSPLAARANNTTTHSVSRIDISTDSANTILRSPYSARSDSITSVDSGQCSGDQVEGRSICSIRQESKEDDEPSYARVASTMDHVLRTSSAIYTLLSTNFDANICRDLLAKSSVFVQLLESSPCINCLPKSEISQLKLNVQGLQKNRETGNIDMNNITNFFAILLRKTIESVLQIFVKIISKYLSECTVRDRLLSICLEHLIHICLFGDELCIEAIQRDCMTSAIRLLRNSPPICENTCRFLLRSLAVLCGVSKGALSLLTQNGLELVVDRLLNTTSPMCSVEAAGILTQLTNPQSAFIRLNHAQPIICRLLDLIDECTTGDSLLLASAALNNVTLQTANGVDIMHKNNAIRRFINAYNRENCATIFVQEQIATAFSRFASRHYESHLVGEGAIPVLLEFLSLTHPVHSDYCRRIRYKAAVCIGTLANTQLGLKSLYDNNAYAILSNVLFDDNNVSNPFNMICNNIRTRLEAKYQSESAV